MYSSSYYQKNKERILEANKKWVEQNREKRRTSQAAWATKNKESEKQRKRKYNEENLDKHRCRVAKEKARRLHRIPKWLTEGDLIEIQWAYSLAVQMSKDTGIQYEVDHIVPLKSKNISGLHCPQNLQILTREENAKKGSSFSNQEKSK